MSSYQPIALSLLGALVSVSIGNVFSYIGGSRFLLPHNLDALLAWQGFCVCIFAIFGQATIGWFQRSAIGASRKLTAGNLIQSLSIGGMVWFSEVALRSLGASRNEQSLLDISDIGRICVSASVFLSFSLWFYYCALIENNPLASDSNRKTRRTLGAGLIILVVSATSILSLWKFVQSEQDDIQSHFASIIDLAGRQRMLSQRLALQDVLNRSNFDDDAAPKNDINQTIKLMVDQSNRLDDSIARLNGQLRSREELSSTLAAMNMASQYRTALINIAEGRSTPRGTQRGAAGNSGPVDAVLPAERFLGAMEAAMSALARLVEAERQYIARYRELWFFICIIVSSLVAISVVRSIGALVFRSYRLVRDSSDKLRLLALVAERTHNAVIITDEHRRIVWVNRGFVTLTGYSSEEAMGLSPGQLLQDESTDPSGVEKIRANLDERKGIRIEMMNRSKEGRRYWVDLDIQPIYNDEGNLSGFIAVESDVTAFVSQRDFFKTVFENSTSGLVIQRLDGAIVDANPTAERLLHCTRDQLLGRSSYDTEWGAISEDGQELSGESHPAMKTARTGQALRGATFGIARGDGQRRWLSVDTDLVDNPISGERWVLSSFVDITNERTQSVALKRAYAAAEASLAKLAGYQEAIDAAAILSVSDPDGIIIRVNDKFCKTSGYSSRELVGARHSIMASGTHSSDFFAEMWRTIGAGRIWQGEVCNRAKDGSLYWVDTTIVPMRDASGKIEAFLSIRFDVTVRKRAEQVLRESIEATPEAFVIYDEQDRLLLSNSAYAATYAETAPILRPGVTFEEVIRFGLGVGQYPHAGTTDDDHERWLKGRMERHRQPYNEALQRLPDGRWLQVREKRTPSGMSVGFRTDVTEIMRQKELLQAVFDGFPGGIAVTDDIGHISMHNGRFAEMLELPDDIRSRKNLHVRDIIRFNAQRGEFGAGNIDEIVESRVKIIASGHAHRYERIRPNGQILEIEATPLPGGGLLTTFVDTTERNVILKQLTEAQAFSDLKARQLTSTLEHMSQGLSMFDSEAKLIVWNKKYLEMYGIKSDDIRVGMSLEEILNVRCAIGTFDGNSAVFVEFIRDHLRNDGAVTTIARLADGRKISVANSATVEGGWVSTHEDVSEQMAAVERITHAAHHDALTGLANRLALKSQITEALRRSESQNEQFSVMMVDLDRFKAVNDTYGHAAGDQLLKIVGSRMRSKVRDYDIVARLGGDEFAILYSVAPNQREASVAIAARVLEAVSAPYDIDGKQVLIGASIGIAIAPDHGASTDELMRNADAALYRVKADGRNGFRVFDDELNREAQAHRIIEADLRSALSLDQFELHYQPVVDLKGRSLKGVEALLRWRHPTKGLVQPGEFIPLLEETGLINPVGDWIIERACFDAMQMPVAASIAVNVSPIQLRNRSMLDVVVRALSRTGLSPDRLEIEVTESVLLERDEKILSDLRQLREIGVRVALDDFGTGYSSLSYLRLSLFDKIKIDRTFVRDVEADSDAAAIVCSVIGLAKNLGVHTTAEGIESATQALLLQAAGCDLGQGYLFGRPVPLAELDWQLWGQGDEMKVTA